MTEFIFPFLEWLTRNREPLEYVWTSTIVEDGRTMLLGRGLTQESAERNMMSQNPHRNTAISPNGILKVVFPLGIRDEDNLPDDIMVAVCEHLGVEVSSNKELNDV